jgi:hypothetical protein
MKILLLTILALSLIACMLTKKPEDIQVNPDRLPNFIRFIESQKATLNLINKSNETIYEVKLILSYWVDEDNDNHYGDETEIHFSLIKEIAEIPSRGSDKVKVSPGVYHVSYTKSGGSLFHTDAQGVDAKETVDFILN